MDVVLYTVGCNDCKTLQKLIDKKGIKYRHIMGSNSIIELGYSTAPILKVDDRIMAYHEAFQWVSEQEG